MNDILAKILAVKAEEVAAARQMRSEAEVLREAQARQDVPGFQLLPVLHLHHGSMK